MIDAKAEITFDFNSREEAEIAYKAIEPELLSAPSDRATVNLNLKGKKIYIKIQAKDSSSFRAAVNTYSRWMKVSKMLMEV